MKDKNFNLVILGLLLLNFYTLSKLSRVTNELENYRQQTERNTNDLRNEINDIYLNVDEKLKKQASILDSYDLKLGDKLNPKNFTVPVTVTITPKQYSDNLKVSLQLNDILMPMEKDKASFKVDANAYIFDDLKVKVILEEDGVQKTETLEEYNNLQYKYILDVMAGFNGSSEFKSNIYEYDGEVNVNYFGSQDNNIEEVSITTEVNGNVIDEESADASNHINVQVQDKLELKAGEKFALYVNTKDKYGLTYKYIVLFYKASENDEEIRSYPELAGNNLVEISDEDGNVLWTQEKDLF
jgi:hypothetical protein